MRGDISPAVDIDDEDSAGGRFPPDTFESRDMAEISADNISSSSPFSSPRTSGMALGNSKREREWNSRIPVLVTSLIDSLQVIGEARENEHSYLL